MTARATRGRPDLIVDRQHLYAFEIVTISELTGFFDLIDEVSLHAGGAPGAHSVPARNARCFTHPIFGAHGQHRSRMCAGAVRLKMSHKSERDDDRRARLYEKQMETPAPLIPS